MSDLKLRNDYEAVINQLWSCCESFLREQGVQRVYTYEREPSVDAQWYKAFLARRGYTPVEQRKIPVMKALD